MRCCLYLFAGWPIVIGVCLGILLVIFVNALVRYRQKLLRMPGEDQKFDKNAIRSARSARITVKLHFVARLKKMLSSNFYNFYLFRINRHTNKYDVLYIYSNPPPPSQHVVLSRDRQSRGYSLDITKRYVCVCVWVYVCLCSLHMSTTPVSIILLFSSQGNTGDPNHYDEINEQKQQKSSLHTVYATVTPPAELVHYESVNIQKDGITLPDSNKYGFSNKKKRATCPPTAEPTFYSTVTKQLQQ